MFGKQANQLDFSFWDGLNQVNVQVVDGEALFALVGGSRRFDKLDVSIKDSYYESRNEIAAVNELWRIVNKPSFKNTKQVSLKIYEDNTRVSETTNKNYASSVKNSK
ncbi:MAG: hypothetical protein KJ799_15775 [Bacteroidetes bacterium]|nr:hypothetical protein [Bacteroidota bacterium]MBU1678860.1 hypothetical protein [Bacteroidota bacterium]MBU2508159.1 hypothetical protein [Bacteroidota bacterium]